MAEPPPTAVNDPLQAADRHLAARDLSHAVAAFTLAEAAGAEPDHCSGGRWFASMLAGDFAAAWRESDAIRSRNPADPQRLWNGEDIAGARVIVRCLHGLGDTVQGLRYAPMLRHLCADVVFEVPPRMVELAPCFAGVGTVATWSDPLSPWDVQVEITELPYLFRTAVSDLPVAEQYLAVPPSLAAHAASQMGSFESPRIGLVWAGGEWDPSRFLPLPLLCPLLDLPGFEFWTLQGDPAAAEAIPLVQAGLLRDATAICGDGLLALAATIANLDLVITTDTLAAHLAGAMGKPVWLLLQHAADWRWMAERDDSPWYPAMRLFRQRRTGDWTEVVERVVAALLDCTVIR